MVATTSSGVGAHKIHTVRGAGSSMLFSKRIGAAFGDSISILDHDHLPPAQSGTHHGSADQLAHLVHADREQFGTHQSDVWMRPGQ